jgi:hypothetical protein
MLSGSTAFAGETVSDIIAAIVTREPDWTALPATHTRVDQAIARALSREGSEAPSARHRRRPARDR